MYTHHMVEVDTCMYTRFSQCTCIALWVVPYFKTKQMYISISADRYLTWYFLKSLLLSLSLDFTAQNISCPFLSKTSTAACFWITACNGIFFIVQHKWCLTVVVIIQWNEYFFFKIHYNDVILSTMASPNHQPRDYLLNYLFKAQIKENIKAPCHWPLWGEFTVNRWIPRTKGQ